MHEVEKRLFDSGVVPVVVLNDSDNAVKLAEALIRGGLKCAEITFRTDAAEESIKVISKAFPEMLVGAGTVLTVDQAERALAAGARFIVSPGYDAELVDYCIEHEVPVFPGCVTPSELMQCAKRGLRTVKFFPCSQFGGLATIKALAAPFVGMMFMPTGGVNASNLHEYLECPRVAACGGSWMVKASLIDSGEYDEIARMTREAVAIVTDVRG